MSATQASRKPSIGPAMENGIARRYAVQRASGAQPEQYRRQARDLTAELPDGACVLEVAPGPGYLAIEIARLGRFAVMGLDISHTFVELATAAAAAASVEVGFRHGDVAHMPFDDETFDLIVTQAAFKNFADPAGALTEMHRVLRPGGVAIVEDMNREATARGIAAEVNGMALSPVSAFTTRMILRWLRRRAYTPTSFQRLIDASPFTSSQISMSGIGFQARMGKQPTGVRP